MTGSIRYLRSHLSRALEPDGKTIIQLAAAACTMFMAVLTLPFVKYLFLLCFTLLSLAIVADIVWRGEVRHVLLTYTRMFWALILTAAMFMIALLRTHEIPAAGLAKETLAVAIALLFGLLFQRALRTVSGFELFQDVLARQMMYLAGAVVVLCAIKFVLLMNDIQFGPLMTAPGGSYPFGTSLLKDYNYFSLALLMAFVAGLLLLHRPGNEAKVRWVQVLLGLIALVVSFSSSRRGIILLVLVNAVLLIMALRSYQSGGKPVMKSTQMTDLRMYWFFVICIGAILFALYHFDENTRIMLRKGLGVANPGDRYQYIVSVDSHGQMNIADTRRSRYMLAWSIFTREYSTAQKLFGNGFGYIKRYADTYRLRNELGAGGPVDYDYPHNPLLSALLSSGLLGFAPLLCYLGMTAWAYVRTWPSTSFFALWQGILLFFGFFSGNTIFSTPWFIMIAFLPVIMQHVKDGEASRLHQAVLAGKT